MKLIAVFILLAGVFPFLSYAQTNSSGIALIKKTVIGGEGGWDYLTVSEPERRIYLSHSSRVEVVDEDSHQKIGFIGHLNGVHGICPVSSVGKGYITNGKAGKVTVFNLKSLNTLLEIPVGEDPDALMYDKYSNRIFVLNNDGKSISVIDVTTDKVVDTFNPGGNPEAAVSNEKGLIYVNLEDANEVVVFDAKTFKIQNRFSLAPGQQPTGLAFDKATNRLFSACRKSQLMIVLDAANGHILAQLPIGKGADGAIFDAASKLAICSNGDGTLTVVKEFSPSKYSVFDTIQTERGARTLSLDSKTNHLFTITAQFEKTPPATTGNPSPRPLILPDTFMLLEYGKK